MSDKKSAEIHRLYGDPSNLGDDLENRDVRPEPIVPDKPNWLSRRGRGIWDFLAPELEKNALLTRRDRESFGFLCEEGAIAIESLLLLRDPQNGYGNLLDTDKHHQNRLRRNPAWIVYTQAKKTFADSAKAFGLDPRSRVGLLLGGGGVVTPLGGDEDEDESVFA